VKEMHITYITCGAFILVYTIFLAAFSLAEFPDSAQVAGHMPFLSDKPVGEDGFYMLEVAWNAAAGKGVTGSNGETVTGIQPLSTLIFAGIAKIIQITHGDKWTFVRAIIAFGGLNLVIFSFLVGKIAVAIQQDSNSAPNVFLLASVMALFNFGLFRLFTYGLETGIYLSFFAGLILFTLRRIPSRQPLDIVIFGLLAGLCGWARIDFGMVFFVFLLMAMRLRLMSLKQALFSGLLALLVITPWLVWVYAQSGSFMPTSGAAQAEFLTTDTAPVRLLVMAQAVIAHANPWLYSVYSEIITPVRAVEMAALVLLATLIYFGRIDVGKIVHDLPKTYFAWCAAVIILIPLYTIFFWATYFYERYTSPLICVMLPFMAIIFSAIFAKIECEKRVIHVFFLALAASFCVFSYRQFHMGLLGGSHSVVAGFVQKYIDKGTPVGSFQTGALAYFNDNVINLDGKGIITLCKHCTRIVWKNILMTKVLPFSLIGLFCFPDIYIKIG
jgi:hypothetical protein